MSQHVVEGVRGEAGNERIASDDRTAVDHETCLQPVLPPECRQGCRAPLQLDDSPPTQGLVPDGGRQVLILLIR